ncbi:MAG TPA: HlyC/CorC family transporter [Oceanithermus profundus]|uniref:HlyC/CorC family transporter n=1 Tax=Oceanithermus profundus TaxID=187137 RepID=A0A7C4ZH46_9DEIN|nr:HlyC/CorC family transporter [Oceanithermus profundus]
MDRPPSRSFRLFALPLLISSAFAQNPVTEAAFAYPWADALLLVALFALSGFFSAAETAVTTLWPWKVRELAEREGEASPFALLQRDITRFLTTILVGNNLVNIAATALVTDLATRAWGSTGVAYATGLMTFLILFFGEITPKSIAVHNADRLARFFVRPIYWLSVLLYPIGRFFTWISALILRGLGLEPRQQPLVTEDELRLILAGAEASGAIEEAEEDMIQNVLELEETQVREIMVPRVDIVAIEHSASLREFVRLEREHRYSRIPVYKESIDQIVGIAYAKNLLNYVETPEMLERLTVMSIAQDAFFVPESMPVWNLLLEIRRRKVHMAIVVDEFGGTAGLVTLEDIIEEIVGEIYDETDVVEEQPIQPQEDGSFLIDAQTPLDDVSEALGVELPEGEYETLSGYLYETFGYIPKVGEEHVYDGFRFVVEAADERKIERVRAVPAAAPAPSEAE